jgi:lipopolysaccharide transport system permease protein
MPRTPSHSHSRLIYHAEGGASPAKAVRDIVEGFAHWPLWVAMSWQDIKLRYRGSMLGPFWLSISMAIMVVSLGLVYGDLFRIDLHDYLPYLVCGLMTWQFMSVMLSEACICFSSAENFIRKIRQPYSVYVYRTVARNLIIFAHNFVIYIGVALYFGIWPGSAFFALFPALILLVLNAVWLCFFLGMLCARFRDITQMINSLIQLLFFVTPIIWRPDLLKERFYLVNFNPFYHFIELVRAPLLGHVAEPINWIVAIGITIAGWGFSFLFFQRFRARLAYWA